MDFFFAKHFRLGGRSDLEFRGEVFNLFNTTNFFNPGGTLNAAIPATPGQANTLQPGQAYTRGCRGPDLRASDEHSGTDGRPGHAPPGAVRAALLVLTVTIGGAG